MGELEPSSWRLYWVWMMTVSAVKKVRAEVPLAEMFGYSTDLRSATQGRATYSMEFKNTLKLLLT